MLITLLFLFGGAAPALACSCLQTRDEAQLREFARDIASRATAFVEVDVRSAYNARTGQGELMRVRRTLAGRAPLNFRIARQHPPSSASCDMEYRAGGRGILVLYPVAGRSGGREPRFRESGLCTFTLLENPRFRELLIEAFRNRRGGRAEASPATAPLPCMAPTAAG